MLSFMEVGCFLNGSEIESNASKEGGRNPNHLMNV